MPKGFSKYNQGGWKHTKETRLIIKEKRAFQVITEATKQKMREHSYWKNKHLPKKMRKKIGKGNKGKVVSETTRLLMGLSHSGEKNWRWKGGITELRKKIRNSSQYQKWRKAILDRDKGLCVLCGNNGKIVDHFPVLFQEIIEKYNIKNSKDALLCKVFWDTRNGRTLCDKCNYLITFKK